jgi:hypothetical protein
MNKTEQQWAEIEAAICRKPMAECVACECGAPERPVCVAATGRKEGKIVGWVKRWFNGRTEKRSSSC